MKRILGNLMVIPMLILMSGPGAIIGWVVGLGMGIGIGLLISHLLNWI